MQLMKWLGCAAVGATLMFAGTSAFAVTIGFSQVGDEGDWRPAFSKDMQDEAKKEGIDLKYADAQGKQENQLKAVRAFIAQKVDAIVIATPFENREELMAGDPEKYFITDHYRNYPAILVRLAKIREREMRDVLQRSWQFVTKKR